MPFPHETLEAAESVPRITIEHASELLERIDRMPTLYPQGAAICIAVFTPSLVKWIVNDCEAEDTLIRLRNAQGE